MIDHVGHCFCDPRVQSLAKCRRNLAIIGGQDVIVLLSLHPFAIGMAPVDHVIVNTFNVSRNTQQIQDSYLFEDLFSFTCMREMRHTLEISLT